MLFIRVNGINMIKHKTSTSMKTSQNKGKTAWIEISV